MEFRRPPSATSSAVTSLKMEKRMVQLSERLQCKEKRGRETGRKEEALEQLQTIWASKNMVIRQN